MTSQGEEKFAGWAILELMGHRRLAGYVQEATLAGSAFLRIDVATAPLADDVPEALQETEPADAEATQFYSPSAVYCVTPTTERIARAFASRARPAPVHVWELPTGRGEPSPHVRAGHYVEDDDELEHVEPDF